MTDNLYEVLGVQRTADKATIKRAFRKLAARQHPDHGGDRDKFERLRFAYDVLHDDLRRAEYDRTGKAAPLGADNSLVPVLTRIGTILDMALQALDQNKKQPKSVDLIVVMVDILDEHQKERAEMLPRVHRIMEIYRSLLGRFKVDDGENRMEAMIRGKIASGEAQIAQLEGLANLDRSVREFLKRYGFNYELPLPAPQTVQYFGLRQGGVFYGLGTNSTAS